MARGDAHQKAPALDRRGFRPRPGERAARGAHGFVGFGGVGAGDFGDDRFVAGIDRRQNAARAARTPFAVDKKSGRNRLLAHLFLLGAARRGLRAAAGGAGAPKSGRA